MSDHQSLIEQQHIPADDGWDDAAGEASERTIRGQLLKFADWRWTVGKEATSIKTERGWSRWRPRRCGCGGKRAGRSSSIIRRPGERLVRAGKAQPHE